MVNGKNSRRNLQLLLLVAVVVSSGWGSAFLSAQTGNREGFPIAITGSNGTYDAPASTGPLQKATGDYVIWINNSDSDMHICMQDTSNQTAFSKTSFLVKSGNYQSVALQPNALGNNHPYSWYSYSDPGGSASDHCPIEPGSGKSHKRIGPKTILVQ